MHLQITPCQRTCSIHLERINKIIDRALEDAEEAKADQSCSDATTSPVYSRIARPSKYEQSNDEDDGSDHHRPQPSFRHRSIIVGLELGDVEFLVIKDRNDRQGSPDEGSKKWE